MQQSEMPTPTDNWKPRSKKKKSRKVFRLEYRLRPRIGKRFQFGCVWRKYWKRYESAKQRDQAMIAMNKSDFTFEYRVPKEKQP